MIDQPLINITGDRIALGPLRKDLVPTYARWMNDFEVIGTLGARLRPMPLAAEESWYDSIVAAGSEIYFTIYDRETLQPIGNTGLHQVDDHHRTAEFGIVIGEKAYWNRGYGTETARRMLEYGFGLVGLRNIWLSVYSYNHRAIRAYRRAGFHEIGRRREARYYNGEWHDIVLMDCLAGEFPPG